MAHLRHELATARGLGSAKEGAHHWWWQRLTAAVLVPLCFWFVLSLLSMTHMNHESLVIWLQGPFTAVLMVSLLLAVYFHAMLGLQVVLEDYIHVKWQKLLCVVLVKVILMFCGLSSIIAVLKIFFSD